MGKIRRDIFASDLLKDYWKTQEYPKVEVEWEAHVEGFVRYNENTPSLIEKWAEEDLNDMETKWGWKEQQIFYELIGEGFMQDE